ncbi:MAG: hypothetical protein LBU73_07090 [Helicobacteraceae bacterium]|jgi:hypothetical protein|nr:hypothetical protein [Helicobacteraceae bacterium]
MKKFMNASDCGLRLINYSKSTSRVLIETPWQYSCLDLLDILKIYTGYNGNDNFDFYNVYEKVYFSTKYGRKNFDEVTVRDFQGISPSTICTFGDLKIEYGFRKYKKWSKVYPVATQAHGDYPSEEEYKYLENVSSEQLAELLKTGSIERFFATSALPLYKDDYLKTFNEKLKEHFTNKYKISDEIYEPTWNSNKLIRK